MSYEASDLTPASFLAIIGDASTCAEISSTERLLRTTSQHHRLAQVLAEGKTPQAAALESGYSLQHVAKLRADPTFQELEEYYRQQAEKIFIDFLERTKNLGLMAQEELQHRLETEPEGFAKRELMELVKLALPSAQQSIAPQAMQPIKISFHSPLPAGANLPILIEGIQE